MSAAVKSPPADLYAYDRLAAAERGCLLCGVDEAGRGPLAGPVYAAAVILPLEPGMEIPGINDSKKLTEKKREQLYDEIIRSSVAHSIAWADEREIDGLNILQATLLAMRRAIQGLRVPPGLALVDGGSVMDPRAGIPACSVVKGDGTSASIAAASILAKVARDRKLLELDEQYPQYRFAKHKGYPTKLHYELLDEYGESPVHRVSFLKKWKAAKK